MEPQHDGVISKSVVLYNKACCKGITLYMYDQLHDSSDNTEPVKDSSITLYIHTSICSDIRKIVSIKL